MTSFIKDTRTPFPSKFLRDTATPPAAGERWKGPAMPSVSQVGGRFASRNTKSLIRSSLNMIFGTPKESIVMDMSFGSDFYHLLFEPASPVTAAEAEFIIADALRQEKRIETSSVSAYVDYQDLRISVQAYFVETGEDLQISITGNTVSKTVDVQIA